MLTLEWDDRARMALRWIAGSVVFVALLVVWLLSRGPEKGISTSPLRWVICLLLPVFISGYGLRKRSLDPSGAALAVLVGFLLTAASACFSVALIVFFLTSSRLTKWKGKEKKKLEDGHKEGHFCMASVGTLTLLSHL